MRTARDRQQPYAVTLTHRRQLTLKTVELHFTRPPGFEFRPGQKVSLLKKSLQRDYTLISAPQDQQLSICLRQVPGGQLSSLLARAAAGDRFEVSAAFGFFCYQSTDRRAVFIATGTGIAPFVAYVRSGVSGFRLLHGVRTAAQLYYRDLLGRCAESYCPCISGLSASDDRPSEAYPGRVTGFIENCLAPGTYDFYLCGGRDMVRDATRIIDRQFADSRVFTETFF